MTSGHVVPFGQLAGMVAHLASAGHDVPGGIVVVVVPLAGPLAVAEAFGAASKTNQSPAAMTASARPST
jgi:hypothetical protein